MSPPQVARLASYKCGSMHLSKKIAEELATREGQRMAGERERERERETGEDERFEDLRCC
jgi:hypothetical protein